MKMFRIAVFSGCLLLSLVSGCAAAVPAPKPNLIYINIDDLGWTDVGFMGSDYYQTPNIDKLASEGMIFTEAYAPASNCAPSRACVMSGQWPSRHGIYTVNNSDRGNAKHRKLIPTPNKEILPDPVITIAEALKAGGYVTCHVGKWHLGEDPKTQGFDVNIGGSTYGHPASYFSPYKNRMLADGPDGEYLTDRLMTETLQFLEDHQDRPFFLNYAFYSVHTPLQAKQEHVRQFKDQKGTPKHNNPTYAAMIASVDENIGRLVGKLQELGLTNHTMILFCSDNGGVYQISKQWPLRAGKGSYYEGGIREPMFVKWPGVVQPNTTCTVPVTGLDFYPTFLQAAGIPKPAGRQLDGNSILPLLTGQAKPEERALFWHFPIYLQGGNEQTQDVLFRTRPGTAMRLGDWKLIEYFENGDLELYNLKEDPSEKNNLAKINPKQLQFLHNRMKQWRQDVKAPVPTEKNPDYDPVAEAAAIQKKRKEQ